MKELTLYREDNGQYSTSEAQQDDVSGVYVQKEHLTDLQKQNDELRANLTEMKRAWQITTNDDCHAMVAAMNKTPAQSLADIRAEAVMELTTSAGVFEHEYTGEMLIGVDDIKDHANRIKEG